MGRSTGDLFRVAVAAGVVTLAFLGAGPRTVDPLEAAVYRDLAQLPHWLLPVSHVAVLAGSVVDIAVMAGVAMLLKQIRLGARLVAGGVVAWVISYFSQLAAHPRLLDVTVGDHQHTLRAAFPADHMAVAAALATVASPYLPRPLRRLLLPVTIVVAAALEFTGSHLTLDVVAGGFIGWAAGTLVHLVSAAPGRSESVEVVTRALATAGFDAAGVTLVSAPLRGPRIYEAATGDGQPLAIEVVRRGQRRAGSSYKLRRLLASLEVEDEPSLSSPRHEVDHEALVTLLAEQAGVRTPKVILAGELGHGPAFLVRHRVDGQRLSDLVADGCGDRLLGEIWLNVARLGRARIAHHNLVADNILVDRSGQPWLVDFTFARTGADDRHLAQEVAEALVSLSAVVGPQRAVDSAAGVLDKSDLREALAYMQPLALPTRIRRQLQGRPELGDLSETLAQFLGQPRPSFRPKIRVRFVISVAVAGGGIYLLLPQIGTVPSLLQAVRHANYWWLVAALGAGAATFPMAAASYLGAVRTHLPFARTTMVQLASAFTSRLTPGGIGGMGLNLIYLQRQGSDRPEAIGSIALNQGAGAVVHAALFVVAIGFLGTSGVVGNVKLPSGWPVLVGVVVVLVLLGAVIGSPFGRRRVLAPARRVLANLGTTLRHPLRALALIGGSAGVTLGNALALAASLAAFDHHFPFLPVIAVYIGGAAIASAAPTPGNLGAVEAALAAGLTGIGVRSAEAVAAVLTFRLLTFWLPIVPGLVALRLLQHRDAV